jgi:hypothetical protein
LPGTNTQAYMVSLLLVNKKKFYNIATRLANGADGVDHKFRGCRILPETSIIKRFTLHFTLVSNKLDRLGSANLCTKEIPSVVNDGQRLK